MCVVLDGLSFADIEELTAISREKVRRQLNRHSQVVMDLVLADVSADWLLLGRGPMRRRDPASRSAREPDHHVAVALDAP